MANIGYARVSSDRPGFQRADRKAEGGRLRAAVLREGVGGLPEWPPRPAEGPGDASSRGIPYIVVRLDPSGALDTRSSWACWITFKAAGAHIKALEDAWLDTTTPHGELILTIMGGMAEFERKLIRARCDEGIRRAKARGTVFGRKPVLDAGEKRKICERFSNGETMADLARDYDVGVATIHRTVHGR